MADDLKHVFHLDFYPRVHLITEHPPADRVWNGWRVPQPTPRELVRYVKAWQVGVGDDEWWESMPNFFTYYANFTGGMDEPILDVDGFTWEPTPMFVPDSGMNRAIAAGHLERRGHELVGYYAPMPGTLEEWGVKQVVRLCCPGEGHFDART